jgi:hypothetical protein
MIFDGFISGAYTHRSRSVDCQELINWYVEITNSEAKNTKILSPTPGTILFSDLGTDNYIRGIYTASTGRLFSISGNSLKEIILSGDYVSRGTINTVEGPIVMADNGVQLIIVDGSHGYILDLATNIFVRITDEDFPETCSHVQFINGRFVVNKTNVNQGNLWWSDLYDGTSWDGAAVASAEGFADKLVSIAKVNNQLWLFGELSTEVFYDTGDSDQPYQRIQGAFFDNGTSAPYSTASTGNTVLWIGSNAQGQGIVWMADGYQPKRVSNHAIEYILQSMVRIDDAIGYCYQQEGHRFYVLTFPTENRTLVYDMTTGFWHERSTYNNLAERDDRHVGNCCCYAFGMNLIGSRNNGKIYRLSKDAYDDDGNIIRRVRTSPHIFNENKRVFYKSFELDMEKGIGLTSGQGSLSNIALQYSNDGGYTWSPELWRTPGRIGTFKTRVKWFNLGMSRDRVFRIIYTDRTSCTLINAYIDIEVER